MNCGPGTIFDFQNQICNHAWATECTLRNSSSEENEQQSQESTEKPESNEDTTSSSNETTPSSDKPESNNNATDSDSNETGPSTTENPESNEGNSTDSNDTGSSTEKPESSENNSTEGSGTGSSTENPESNEDNSTDSNETEPSTSENPELNDNSTESNETETSTTKKPESNDNSTEGSGTGSSTENPESNEDNSTESNETEPSTTENPELNDNSTEGSGTGSSDEDSDEGNSLEGVDPNTLSCDPEGQVHLLLPHHTTCDKFYTCDHGQEVEMSCPAGTIFDFELQTCNHIWATECVLRSETDEDSDEESSGWDGSGDYDEPIAVRLGKVRPIILDSQEEELTVQEETLQAFRQRALDCSSSGDASQQVPYKGDCQRYWRCEKGLPRAVYCNEGLSFNSQTQQCDHEANVRCDSIDEIYDGFLR